MRSDTHIIGIGVDMQLDPQPDLPSGWVACLDPTHGQTYYFDLARQCSQWEVPERGAGAGAQGPAVSAATSEADAPSAAHGEVDAFGVVHEAQDDGGAPLAPRQAAIAAGEGPDHASADDSPQASPAAGGDLSLIHI